MTDDNLDIKRTHKHPCSDTNNYTQHHSNKTHHFIMIMLFDMSNYKCMM